MEWLKELTQTHGVVGLESHRASDFMDGKPRITVTFKVDPKNTDAYNRVSELLKNQNDCIYTLQLTE